MKEPNFDKIKSDYLGYLNQKFRNVDINQHELNDLLSKLNNQVKNVRNTFKKNLLMNESISFVKYENSGLFGKLSFHSIRNKVLSKCLGQLIQTFEHSKSVNCIQVD